MSFCIFPRFKAWCRRVERAVLCRGGVPSTLDAIIKELMSTAQDLKTQTDRATDLAAKVVTLVNTLDAEIQQLQGAGVVTQEELDAAVTSLTASNDALAAMIPADQQ